VFVRLDTSRLSIVVVDMIYAFVFHRVTSTNRRLVRQLSTVAEALSRSILSMAEFILGSSRPFDDIREGELHELAGRYDGEGDTQSEATSVAEHKRFRLLSPPKKVKAK
jgi:hypothetical protein